MESLKEKKTRRIKLVSLLTAVIICFNIFPVSLVMADDTVSISTVNDLKNFVEKCVYDDYSRNKLFVLENDIDLNGEEIKSAEVFCGTFEGGGHTIKNVKMSFEGSTKGFFNSVTSDAQIKNLNISGEVKAKRSSSSGTSESAIKQRAAEILSKVDIEIESGSDTSSKSVGAFVGYNSGKIYNCSFSGNIEGQKRLGGIVGFNAMSGIIDSCTNEATVNGDSEVGGIVGYNEGRVKFSKNNGSVASNANENTESAGGICGNNEGAIDVCTNYGSVGGESFGDNIGGICGMQTGEIKECINNGTVKGRRSVGGICGRFEPYTDIDLSYESAKAALKKQADIFKDDIENAKTKILDYAVDLLTGAGDFKSIMSALGFSDSLDGLKNLNDSAINALNSISDALNTANSSSLTSTLRDTIEKAGNDITSFSDETKQSVRDASNSISDTLTSVDEFLDEFDGKGAEITRLLDNLNDSIDRGSDDVKEIRNSLTERLDSLEDSTDDMLDKLSVTNNDVRNTLRQIRNVFGDVGDAITTPFDKLETATNNIEKEFKALKTKIETLKKEVDSSISDKIGTQPTASPTATPESSSNTTESSSTSSYSGGSSRKSSSASSSTSSESKGYSADPNAEPEAAGYEVVPIAGLISDLLFTTAYAAGDYSDSNEKENDDEKTAISDLRSTDISLPRLIGDENADTALIEYCINNGDVNCTELAGGVIGSTGFESIVRTGENIKLPDGTQVSADAVLKAVTNACISSGNITAKNDYAGGICGRSDIGNIRNSLTTGEITVTDGAYAGGIAGESSGDITNCIAINDVYGDNHIGGIAGSGKEIKSSYSLPRIYGATDKSGAVAGFITGDVYDTYFIDEGLGGIDGANLAGKAEAVPPEDIASSDGTIPWKMSNLSENDFYMETGDLYMPQIKALAKNNAENIGALLQSKSSEMSRFHFNVTFKDKDKELKSMTVDYGTTLSQSDIPKLSADGGEIPMWNRDTTQPIIRHTVFDAVYNKATTTISTGETPALLLVESVFDDNTNVSLKDEKVDYDFDGYKQGNAYSFKLTHPAYDVIKVHIRDESKKAVKIAVYTNDKWQIEDCTVDGSYAVFSVNEPCKFVILYDRTSPVVPIVVTVLILAVLAAAAYVLKRFHKVDFAAKKKNKKDNADTEDTEDNEVNTDKTENEDGNGNKDENENENGKKDRDENGTETEENL